MHIFRPVSSMQFARFCMAVGTLSGIAALGLGGQTAWADSSCTPPANGPTGPSATTFVYQCDGTYAGDWTNSYYVYDPNNSSQTALYSPDYSYNCATGTWTQAEWDYDTGSGAYIENRVAATAPPNQPTNCANTGDSNSSTANAGSGNAASTTTADPPADNTPATTPDTSTSAPTGTPSPDPTGACVDPSALPDTPAPASTSDTTVNNNVCSAAQSGNATVDHNQSAGDATSGDATAEVNVATLVDSLNNALGSGTVTFTKNIDGTVNGDLVLDPSAVLASDSNPATLPENGIGSASSSAAINNNINVSASTGNALVLDNGTAGDATSGNADAIVNLINIINSAIASGKSFIGTININGDLNGNILIPQSLIDELLGSNAASTYPADGTSSLSSNESITNNIDASATSGNASVADNYIGGDATSGNANTNVTLLNLTGSSIIGKNVLLVFVNVLGQWVGMIVNAPAGSTSAEFGGGITSDSPSTGGGVVEAGANLSITNNVDASAATGDATVANNFDGGNATTGNAETAVNVLNMENSDLSLANWFGILFINVFGTWDGNFGILPTPAAPSSVSDGSQTQSDSSQAPYKNYHHFASFLPSSPAAIDSDVTNPSGNATAILGDATIYPSASKLKSASSTNTAASAARDNYVLPALGVLVAALILGIAERDRFTDRKNK